jgi:hypothetical protein
MTAAGLVCSSCGIELPENAKFCLECGVAVSAVSKPAEYKQVTVLFADVVIPLGVTSRNAPLPSATYLSQLRSFGGD